MDIRGEYWDDIYDAVYSPQVTIQLYTSCTTLALVNDYKPQVENIELNGASSPYTAAMPDFGQIESEILTVTATLKSH